MRIGGLSAAWDGVSRFRSGRLLFVRGILPCFLLLETWKSSLRGAIGRGNAACMAHWISEHVSGPDTRSGWPNAGSDNYTLLNCGGRVFTDREETVPNRRLCQ